MRKTIILTNLLAGVCGLCSFGCKMSIPEKNQNPVITLVQKLLPDSSSQREALQKELTNPDPDRRREAVYKLGHGQAKSWDVTPRILRLMAQGDPDPQVRTAAVQVLAQLESAPDKYTDPTTEAFQAAAKDKSSLVRRECVEPLSQRPGQKNMDILLDLLRSDPDAGIRAAAAAALKNVNDPLVISALVQSLSDNNFGVIYQTRLSLKQLTGEDFGYNPAPWQQWLKTHTENKIKN